MAGYLKDIRGQAILNSNFRKVLETGKHTQVVLMSIKPGEDIGEEVHKDNDQVLLMVEGEGLAVINKQEITFEECDLFLVPAGTSHNFINGGEKDLKIITTYSPPHHPEGTIHQTKEEASKANY